MDLLLVRARLLCVSMVLLLLGGNAFADKRLAVLEIEGARTPSLRKSVVRLLEPNVTMSAQAYRNAAKRLRAKKLTPKNIKRVSRYLEADGVVDGTLESVGGRYRLILRVRSGARGTIVKKITLMLAKASISSSIEKKLRLKLQEGVRALDSKQRRMSRDSIDENDSDRRGEDTFVEDDERDDRRKEESESEARRRRRLSGSETSGRSRDRDDSEDDDFEDDDNKTSRDDEDDDFQDVDDRKSSDDDDDVDFKEVDDDEDKGDGARQRSVLLFAGVGAMSRDLSFNTEAGIPEPPSYDGSFVPTAYIAGEIYPFGLSGKGGIGSVLGITGSYERALTISTAVPNMADMTVGTVMDRYRVGGILRYSFGDDATSPSIALTAGYNVHRFDIKKEDSPVVIDIPDTKYVYIDPGLVLRYPISKVAFFADVRGILILDAGEIQDPAFYGAAKVTGVDADVGFEYSVTPRILVRVGGRVSFFGFDFNTDGTPADMSDRNGDGIADVPGASDSYLGGYFALGFQY